MSEFETLLTRIDKVQADVQALAVSVTACQTRCNGNAAKRGKWVDRLWTLGVCLAGGALGFLLKR